jgi:Putative polyhydroxyalkanoic acid system protein (PHA_gran_rgn)
MPDMTATIPHQLPRAEAKRLIQEHVSVMRQQYGTLITNLQDTWRGDTMAFSLSAMGQTISGRLTVDDHVVYLTVALPWLLRMLAETIKPRIEQQGRLLLSRQTISTSPR